MNTNFRILLIILSWIISISAGAQSGKWDVGFITGLGKTEWLENYSTSGQLRSPNFGLIYTGDGVGFFVNAAIQYKFGRWRIGPSLAINNFQIGEVAEERNGQTLPTTARPPAVDRATLMGLKLNYVWSLRKKFSLSWGVEGGILHLGDQNDFFEKKKYYSAGLQFGKNIGRLTPILGVGFQKIMFDYPDYLINDGASIYKIHQDVRSDVWQAGIGFTYKL